MVMTVEERAQRRRERWCRDQRSVHSLEDLHALIESTGSLRQAVIRGVDLRGASAVLGAVDVEGACFLGCSLDADGEESVRSRAALVFPRFGELPYDPFRSCLYTWRELLEGFELEGDQSLDARIYRHFERHGRHLPRIEEALAQRVHDHAIDDALRDVLDYDSAGMPEPRVVGIMGGHSEPRGSETFRRVAELGWRLARAGYLVTTGGGPGVMEAGNLGAYLSSGSLEDLETAIEVLSERPRYDDSGYVERGLDVIERFPEGGNSLAVPTWFYGHEPSNVFARWIAKYFSNSLREDGLLAISLHGVVFAPGSAGTIQEVFMDATQNHYATFGYVSPMVFLGRSHYEEKTGVLGVLRRLAGTRRYAEMLYACDDAADAVDFLKAHPPVRSE